MHRVPGLGLVVLVASLATGVIGCGGKTGWLIKPVPLDEELMESVLASNAGMFDGAKIAVIDVDGILLNQRQEGMFGSRDNPVSLFVEKINRAQADRNVRALVLRINSPGGGVTASDIMYRRLMQFRQTRKVPVVAIIEDVGASGGYYVACGADVILAHPTSTTGSIGVIVQTISFAGTMEKLGITGQAVISGKYKDMASPLKPLKQEDIVVLQEMVDSLYDRFVKVVAKARPKLAADKLATLADGRVYTAQQAVENGLIDAVGYVDDAINLAKEQCDAKRVTVVMYHRPLGSKSTIYSASQVPAPQVNLINFTVPDLLSTARPKFMYLWTGRQWAPPAPAGKSPGL